MDRVGDAVLVGSYSSVWDFIRELDTLGGLENTRYLIKHKEDESQYGYHPWNRPLKNHIENGIINLDKPPGPTSHEVTAWVKKMLKLSKAGHAGTLGVWGRSRRERCSGYCSRERH